MALGKSLLMPTNPARCAEEVTLMCPLGGVGGGGSCTLEVVLPFSRCLGRGRGGEFTLVKCVGYVTSP